MGVTPFQAMYQCRGLSWETRGDRASWGGRWTSSADRMDTCTSGAQRRGNRAISPYDYIRCGETSEKVDCSIGSAWVGAGAAFDKRGYSEVWGGPRGSRWAQDQFFLGDLVFLCWAERSPGATAPTSRRLSVVVRSSPLYPRGGPKWRDNYHEEADHQVAPNRLEVTCRPHPPKESVSLHQLT